MTMNKCQGLPNPDLSNSTFRGSFILITFERTMKMNFFRFNLFSKQLKCWVSTIILGVIFSFASVKKIDAESRDTPQLITEAQILVEREAQFFNARQIADWAKIHSFQHPDFRKKVSVDEVRYFEGWVTHDYRERAKQNSHISGAAVPTLDFMKKHPNKFDPLGFPVARRYVFSGDPHLNVKTYSLEKISISKNGKYAKVSIMVVGKQRINPVIARGLIEFDAAYPLTDFWEKVDGNWVITLLSAPVSNSGAGILKYYLPNNNSTWKKMDFVELYPYDLNLS